MSEYENELLINTVPSILYGGTVLINMCILSLSVCMSHTHTPSDSMHMASITSLLETS